MKFFRDSSKIQRMRRETSRRYGSGLLTSVTAWVNLYRHHLIPRVIQSRVGDDSCVLLLLVICGEGGGELILFAPGGWNGDINVGVGVE